MPALHDSARRSVNRERRLLALRDAREPLDVLAVAARGLGRDYKRPCVAYELRPGALHPVASSDAVERPPLEAAGYDLDALRTRVVLQRDDAHCVAIASNGTLHAMLVLEKAREPLRDDDLRALRAFAAHVAVAFAEALAFHQLRQYAAEGAALTEAARTILGFTQLEPLAASLCRLSLRLVDAQQAAAYALREESFTRIAYANFGRSESAPLPEMLEQSEGFRLLSQSTGLSPVVATALLMPSGDAGTSGAPGMLLVSRAAEFEKREVRLLESLVTLAALAIRNVDLYEQSTRANQALAESNAFKDDLMAMFAHDFKGPLTVISGFSELLLEASDRAVRRTGRTISEQTRRLAKLSEDALALAATQSAGFSLHRERQDLNAFVRGAVAPLDRAGDRVVIRVPAAPVFASFDNSRLRHVLENVVGNALKYSSGPVDVRVTAGEREARVAVQDAGFGIPAAELERVFSRFGRASNVRSRGISGSGVGLYIAKKIVEVHGGRLEAVSQENHGSTFTICLPL